MPFGDSLHLDNAVDLVLLTQSIDPASFTLECVYEDSSDLACFTLSIDLFCYLGVIIDPHLQSYSINRKQDKK